MQSAHAPLSAMSPATSHTQLLHLNPDPNVTISTLSPRLNLPFASMYDSTYHTLLADVFPHLCNVILNGSTSRSSSPKLFFTASITATPPAWRQMWSTPALRLIFSLVCPRWRRRCNRFCHARSAASRAISMAGRTRGRRRCRLAANARSAALGRALLMLTPRRPSSSSRCMMQE
ncbi:Os03g0383100 [Oryza sativa Japonica Group]|uniref:Expressed protein n=1 Tax=Oryza sativa subsp. japonica TaxID=39947 RepID=Q10KI3_ORYSJ|nr:expressed protein [Oryza sativa Japonica Group]BAS84458.1 Os03g0383100 [Oryza sativa Japonica Group]